MGGRVADLSAMMKITRPCGKCWDVTPLCNCVSPFSGRFHLDFFTVCLTLLLDLSFYLLLSLNLFTSIACERRLKEQKQWGKGLHVFVYASIIPD